MHSEMSSPAEQRDALRRVLGPFDATCIVVGAIVGVGIFFTPSSVARTAGSGGMAMAAWAIGGGIALLGALTFAELGGLYPRTGGQYEILRDAYGPMTSFVYVFCNATAIQAGAIAIIALICADNLGLAAGGDALTGRSQQIVAVGMIVGLTGANALGVKFGSSIQNLTVVAKIGTLLAVTLVAAFAAPTAASSIASQASTQPAGGAVFGPLAAALVPAAFSFGGWQHALWMGGEVRRPERNVPRAIIVGVLVVIAVYLLANWAYLRLLGYDGVVESKAIAADAVASVWPLYGKRVIAGAVAVSAFGVLNAQLLSGPRLIYRMATDGRFPSVFAAASRRFKTPVAAIALLGGMALCLLWVAVSRPNGFDDLLNGVVLIDVVFFAITGSALIRLRSTRPKAARPVRVPGYPVLPILFVAGELAILVGAFWNEAHRDAAYVAVAWIIAAGVCFLLWFRESRGSDR